MIVEIGSINICYPKIFISYLFMGIHYKNIIK
jgi:hypothetical protein